MTATGKINMAIDDAWVFLKFKSQEEEMYRDLPMEAWDSGTPAGAARYEDMAEEYARLLARPEAQRNLLTPDDLNRLSQRVTRPARPATKNRNLTEFQPHTSPLPRVKPLLTACNHKRMGAEPCIECGGNRESNALETAIIEHLRHLAGTGYDP